MIRKWLGSCACAAIASGLLPVIAHAADDAPVTTLPEVLVQARRITENQQQTPLAVTTLGPETLRQETITEVTDIQKDVPSLEISPSALGGDGAPTFTIRGLSTTLLTDPAVVTYFDSVVADPRNFAYSLYDLQSVQVLKGPQGTLFGRNSTGGAVLFQPTRPGKDFGGYIDLRYGSLNDREATAAVDLPVSDQLKIRIAGDWEQRDGTLKSVGGGFSYNNRNHDSIRFEADWRPSDRFDNYLQATAYRVREVNNAPILKHVGSSACPGGFPYNQGDLQCYFTPYYPPADTNILADYAAQQALGKDKTPDANRTPFNVDYTGVTDIAEFRFNGLTLRNIVHADSAKYLIGYDLDGSNAPIVNQVDSERNHFYSEELQLLGKSFDNRLTWIIGAYYSDLQQHQSQAFQQADWPAFNALPFFYFPANPLGEVNVNDTVPQKSTALFAHLNYDLSQWVSGLSLSGGYRQTWDRKSFTDQRLAPNAPFVYGTNCALTLYGLPADPATCTRSLSAKWNDGTYDVSLNWQANANTLVYLTTRKGYKAGGFNFTASNPAYVSYAPEEIKDLELGLKADWSLGGMPVRTNVAIYRADYTNIQSQVTDFSGPIPQLLILNVDPATGASNKATLTGGEIEFTARPTPSLTVNGWYGYAKGTYSRFDVLAPNPAPPPPVFDINLHGQSIAGIVPVTAGASLLWSPDVRDGWGHPTFSAFLYHQGSQTTNTVSANTLGERGYTNLDLRLDWRRIGGAPVDLAVYGKNVTGERHITAGTDLTGLADVQSVEWSYGTVWGVQLRYHFGAGN